MHNRDAEIILPGTMKRHGITAVIVFTLLSAIPAAYGDTLHIGSKAPTFYLPGLDDSKFFLSKNIAPKGNKIVVLDFYATWCVPCRKELPLLIEIVEKHAADSVLLVLINVGESPDTVRTWVSLNKWQRPLLLDRFKAVSGKYGVKTLPSLFIIDRNGVISYSRTGFEEKTGIFDASAVLDSLTGSTIPPSGKRETAPCVQK
jgi:thiol-disulfide isomerase/thioredoxin